MGTTLRSRRKIGGMTGTVLSVEGVAHPSSGVFGDANQLGVAVTHRVKVGSMTFAVAGAKQLFGFEDGAAYRAYYVKSTIPVLISAERI